MRGGPRSVCFAARQHRRGVSASRVLVMAAGTASWSRARKHLGCGPTMVLDQEELLCQKVQPTVRSACLATYARLPTCVRIWDAFLCSGGW